MKSILFVFLLLGFFTPFSRGEDLSFRPCPTRTFNILDYILPGRNYFLETGYVFNYELSDPGVASFRLNDVFRPSNLSWDISRRLKAELPADDDPGSGSASGTAADIFYGFLGQTMESSISRVVGGDASLIIGYSSNSAYSPAAIKEKVRASLNQGAMAGGSDPGMGMYVREFLAFKKAVTAKAESRFGTFQGLIYDRQMRIRGIKFAHQTFMKVPGSRGFSTSGNALSLFDSDGI
ncbi:MAG: hypothetical protein A2X86_03255 [Bdellovibrionales bacterium GWA2_49_15]|nr:MAG: hypothetical protein A2X86_03255 [Bdellovibrionales bacterium GWA2_49_15]HAZ12232.1 hypothetical protein [Bdellovibrionales bacterium]